MESLLALTQTESLMVYITLRFHPKIPPWNSPEWTLKRRRRCFRWGAKADLWKWKSLSLCWSVSENGRWCNYSDAEQHCGTRSALSAWLHQTAQVSTHCFRLISFLPLKKKTLASLHFYEKQPQKPDPSRHTSRAWSQQDSNVEPKIR